MQTAQTLIRQRSGNGCSCSAAASEGQGQRRLGGVSGNASSSGRRQQRGARLSDRPKPSSGLPYENPAIQAVDLQRWTAPKVHAHAWTDLIVATTSPDELQRCLSGLHSLNKIHLTAAINKLASFGRGPQRAAGLRMVPHLLLRAKESLPNFHARSLVAVAHCLGAYEVKDKDLMAAVAKGAESAFPEFNSIGLANLLWSFARLSIQPSPTWMDAYLATCQAKLARFRPQEMSMLLWALAKLKVRLAPAMMKAMLQRVIMHLPDYSPQSISNVLWALGVLDQRPEDAWLDAVVHEMTAKPKLRKFTHQGLSQALWALALLRYQPTPQFTTTISAAIRSRLAHCKSIDLATFMYACAGLSLPLREHMVVRLQTCKPSDMKAMQPSHLAKVVWSFAKKGVTPSTPWLLTLLSIAHQLMDTFNARDLAMFAWGMAKLKIAPPRAFLLPMVQRIELLAAEFPPQEVANTIWALASFHVRPSPVLLAQFFEATEQRLSTFEPPELSQMLGALADRHCTLDQQWVQEFLKVSFLRLPDFSSPDLSHIAWALARLRLSPPPAWLLRYARASAGLLSAQQLQAQDLGMIVNALGSMNQERPLQQVSDFLIDAMDALACMEMDSQAYTRSQLERMLALHAPALRPSSTAQWVVGGAGAEPRAGAEPGPGAEAGAKAGAGASSGFEQQTSQQQDEKMEEAAAPSQVEVDVGVLRDFCDDEWSKAASRVQAVQAQQDEAARLDALSKAASQVQAQQDEAAKLDALSKAASRVQALQAQQDEAAKLKSKHSSNLQQSKGSKSSAAAQLFKGIKGARQQQQQQQQQQQGQQQQRQP